jgi:Phytanoyl-CoA dioxygenase (PhyH)
MPSVANLAKALLEPPPYHSGGVWLNRAGWQLARTLPHHAMHRLRRRRGGAAVADLVAAAEKDGILVIRNFLPEADFARLSAYCQALAQSAAMRREPNRAGSGVDWLYGPIAGSDAATQWVRQRIALNEVLLGVVAGIVRRKIVRAPQMGYQRLTMREGANYIADAEAVLHADRHFPTVKAYYSLNASTEDNGAYVWVRGSHRLTLARLAHEYDYSIRQAMFAKGGADALPAAASEAGMVKIAPEHLAAMGVEEEAILTEPNTMVISNNFGFHRRGYFKAAAVREQIRLVFHYLEEPFYATWLWRGLAALQARRMLPERLRRAVQYRLT